MRSMPVLLCVVVAAAGCQLLSGLSGFQPGSGGSTGTPVSTSGAGGTNAMVSASAAGGLAATGSGGSEASTAVASSSISTSADTSTSDASSSATASTTTTTTSSSSTGGGGMDPGCDSSGCNCGPASVAQCTSHNCSAGHACNEMDGCMVNDCNSGAKCCFGCMGVNACGIKCSGPGTKCTGTCFDSGTGDYTGCQCGNGAQCKLIALGMTLAGCTGTGSDCTISLAAGTSAQCDSGATCDVTCMSKGCKVDCYGGANNKTACTLHGVQTPGMCWDGGIWKSCADGSFVCGKTC